MDSCVSYLEEAKSELLPLTFMRFLEDHKRLQVKIWRNPFRPSPLYDLLRMPFIVIPRDDRLSSISSIWLPHTAMREEGKSTKYRKLQERLEGFMLGLEKLTNKSNKLTVLLLPLATSSQKKQSQHQPTLSASSWIYTSAERRSHDQKDISTLVTVLSPSTESLAFLAIESGQLGFFFDLQFDILSGGRSFPITCDISHAGWPNQFY